MDFSKLPSAASERPPENPIEIFEKLPNLPGTPNDLWRGQTDALKGWQENRGKKDILISLNTGAGKTLVGLLVAQSLVNEGVEKVIYVCATIDLVIQTSREAEKIGLAHTTRISGGFNNDLFESGKSFCITTYHAVFNGLSSIRKRHFPGAIIFDDAHVAETILRDSFTLEINKSKHPNLFDELEQLFRPNFVDLNREGEFEDSLTREFGTISLVPPNGAIENQNRLSAIFRKYKLNQDNDLKFSFSHLKDHLNSCAILFGYEKIEFSPAFLPSLAIDIFERPIKRIYLSATLKYVTDFVRAFGRKPGKTINPKNDAGNGERLVLMERTIVGEISPEMVQEISNNHKVLISVPNYYQAEKWSEISKPPKKNEFSEKLESFRADETGAFILVARIDGIDLPKKTCRCMVIDGLPRGSSLIERYQVEFLRMNNFQRLRLANKLAQLFGRINRGRNDYGVFLIKGHEINTWLNNDRNVALLPDLLKRQILLGRVVQEGMDINNKESILETLRVVFQRDQGWIDYYNNSIDKEFLDENQVAFVERIEPKITDAAIAEAKFAKNLWNGDVSSAIESLEETVAHTSRADRLIAGWENIWLGGAYMLAGDEETALLRYSQAKSQLGPNIALPSKGVTVGSTKEPLDDAAQFTKKIDQITGVFSQETYIKNLKIIENGISDLDGGSSSQMEEAVCNLGDLLGFVSSRPDNEHATGPDVLWREEKTKINLAIELKTDKEEPATYFKKETSQAHDNLTWVKKEFPDEECLGILFIGPLGSCDPSANPSDEMWLSDPQILAEIRNEIISLIKDNRGVIPLNRRNKVLEECEKEKWNLKNLFGKIRQKQLIKN